MNTLAALSGQSLVNLVIWLIVAELIYWVVTWALSKIPIPEPFSTIIRVILVLIVAIICVNALLAVAGHPLIVW